MKMRNVESFEANSGFSLQCFTAAYTMPFTALEIAGIPIDEHAFVPVVSVEREVSVERRLEGRVRQLRVLPHKGPAAESRQLVAHGLI